MHALLKSRIFWITAIAGLVAALLPAWLSPYLLGVLTSAYYFGVFAMSWDLLFGFAGEVNFGPTFLIGLGAYSAAILNLRREIFSEPVYRQGIDSLERSHQGTAVAEWMMRFVQHGRKKDEQSAA